MERFYCSNVYSMPIFFTGYNSKFPVISSQDIPENLLAVTLLYSDLKL